jgi:hypothetical protein
MRLDAVSYQDYLEPRYTFREGAIAAAFPLNTLRSNYQRGWFQSFGEGLATRRGSARKLCLGDILVLAIASRLIDQGERPLNAYNAALPFGLVGSTPKALREEGHPPRRPFELFNREHYDTYLLWRRGSAARVVPVAKGNPVRVEEGLDEEGRQFGVATTVLPLNAVEATVLRQLGLLPADARD